MVENLNYQYYHPKQPDTNDKATNISSEMDDGGRCLLDVINDPQLLQSFLENSNNNNSQQTTVTNSNTSSSSTIVVGLTQNSPTTSTTVINNKNNDLSSSTSIVTNTTTPNIILTSTATTTTTTITKNETVRAKKSSYIATKSSPHTASHVKSAKHHHQIISISSSHTTTTNSNTLVPPNGILLDPTKQPSAATTPLQATINSTIIPLIGGQNLVGPGSQTIQLNASNALNNTTTNVQAIRHPASSPASSTNATFVPTQFQLGPRPMTVLPQQFILPGGLQVGQPGTIPTQFVLAPRPPAPNPGNIQPGQLLQIIHTSQGPQILQQTNNTSNVPTIVTTTSSTTTTSKNSKGGSNKQILPKPNSIGSMAASIPATQTATQAKNIQSNNSTTNLINSQQAQNIKLIQQPVSAATATFQTQTNVQAPTQFLLGSGPQQHGIISGPNGTFLVNNIVPNLSSTPFLFQGNVSNQPLQLAIRPQTPLFVNSNTLTNHDQTNLNLTIAGPNSHQPTSKSGPTTAHHIVLNQTTPTASQSGGLMMTTAPNVRPGAAPTNIIIRPQIISQPTPPPITVPQQPQNQTPQLLQIQTPNGPILLSLNLNPQTQVAAPPPPPQPILNTQQQPQTIQIGNTVISLTTNNSTLNLPGATSTHHLPTTILTHQQPQDNLAIHPTQPSIPISSSPLILTSNPQSTLLNNNKSTTNQQPLVSPNAKPKTTQQSKGLNLHDLLKETGILTDFSPPNSPPPSTTTIMKNSSNSITFDNNTNIQTTTILDQQPPALSPSAQSTVLMVPGGLNSTTPNLLLTQNSNLLSTTSTTTSSQQLRISLAPDGNIVFLSPNSNSLLGTNQLQSTMVVQNTQQSNNTSKLVDSSGLGSSQPSPDSTTPSIDATTTSSPPTSIPQSSQTTTTTTTTTIDSSQKNPLDNVLEESNVVVSSLSLTTSALSSTITTTTQSVDTSPSITKSVFPSQIVETTSGNLAPTTTFTAVLLPGTIMFVNDNRVPLVTINRSNLPELLQRIDLQLKNLNTIKQPNAQQKELKIELTNLQKNLSLIQSQQLPPNQIPQVKISLQVQQLLQLQKPLTNQSNTTTTITTTTTTNNSTNSVQFVIGSKINSNSMQLVQTSPINTAVQQTSPSVSATTTVPNVISVDSNDKVIINPNPSAIIKQEKPKPNVLKAIQSQLHADQNTALHPDCRTPFRSRDDACKRLLRYHVFDQPIPSEKEMKKFDELYENISQTLLYKKDLLYDKFRYLLLKQSMKDSPSSEHVMINRMIVNEETNSLKTDKELVASGGVLDLPPLPECWLQKNKKFNQDNDGMVNGTKRKFDDDEIDSINYVSTHLPNITSESLNQTMEDFYSKTSDLNDLCEMFDDEHSLDDGDHESNQQNKVSNNLMSNLLSNDNVRSNDVVEELIKQLNSPIDHQVNHDDDNFLDNFVDNVPLNQNSFIDSTSSHDNSLNMVADDLEALYSNIASNDHLVNQTSNLSWQDQSSSSNFHCSTNSLSHHHHNHHNHLMATDNNSNHWTSRYGNVNETEAAVAVQSIIDDATTMPLDDHNSMDFPGIELNTTDLNGLEQNNHPFDGEEVDDEDDDDEDDDDEDEDEDGTNTATTTSFISINDSANDIQMHCAIKSIMMPPSSTGSSSNYPQTTYHSQHPNSNHHINNATSNTAMMHNSNNYSPNNNSMPYQHSLLHHQQGSHMNQSSMLSNHHNLNHLNMRTSIMNAYGPTATPIVNDPMLDEAVKSIL